MDACRVAGNQSISGGICKGSLKDQKGTGLDEDKSLSMRKSQDFRRQRNVQDGVSGCPQSPIAGLGSWDRGRWPKMMPLNLAEPGEEQMIRKIGGSPEVRKHLADLGFIAGGTATVVSALNGNLIVKVKESRVALSEELARKIMV